MKYEEIVAEIYNNNKNAIKQTIEKGVDGKNISLIVWMSLLSTLMASAE